MAAMIHAIDLGSPDRPAARTKAIAIIGTGAASPASNRHDHVEQRPDLVIEQALGQACADERRRDDSERNGRLTAGESGRH